MRIKITITVEIKTGSGSVYDWRNAEHRSARFKTSVLAEQCFALQLKLAQHLKTGFIDTRSKGL